MSMLKSGLPPCEAAASRETHCRSISLSVAVPRGALNDEYHLMQSEMKGNLPRDPLVILSGPG